MFAYKTLKSGTDIRGVASEGGGAPINLTDESWSALRPVFSFGAKSTWISAPRG